MQLKNYLFCLASISLAPSLALCHTPAPRSIYTFPPNHWIENLAVRSNSKLLVTSLSVPTLYELNPLHPNSTPSIVHTFDNGTGNSGITEISPDVFAVINGVWEIAKERAVLGTLSIYIIDFFSSPNSPGVKHVANVPNSTCLNGLAAIPFTPYILASESASGVIWRINTLTGKVDIAFASPFFDTLNASSPGAIIGINGIKIHDSFVYFSTTSQGLFGRVPINGGGDQVGNLEISVDVNVTATGFGFDDFSVTDDGTAWIATHPDSIMRVAPDQTQFLISNASVLHTPSSTAFGRGSVEQSKTLYITVAGTEVGVGEFVNGGVAAIDMTYLWDL
ncbi:hypothetical protein F5884DRAFT_812696 [Xylogone sp. PMI_703]|nr:hypothetical protein F5884DRAFT_812696 [Xylogone sp. PMI_703]